MTNYSNCENCKVRIDDEFIITIEGDDKGSCFCALCFEYIFKLEPSAYIGKKYHGGCIIEFQGPKPPGPKRATIPTEPLKDENKACMEIADPVYRSHTNRLDALEERASNLGAHQNSTALHDIKQDERLTELEKRTNNLEAWTPRRINEVCDESAKIVTNLAENVDAWRAIDCKRIAKLEQRLDTQGSATIKRDCRIGDLEQETTGLDCSADLLALRVKELETRVEVNQGWNKGKFTEHHSQVGKLNTLMLSLWRKLDDFVK